MAIDLTRIGKLHTGLVAAGTAAAYLTGVGAPLSLALGGAIMGANFLAMRWITGILTAADPNKPGRATLALLAFIFKFGLFLALLAGLFWRLPIEGMSFAFGVTLLLVACVIEALRSQAAAVGQGISVKGAS